MDRNRQDYFIGIDVGTGSARAGVFDAAGKMLGSASRAIEMWKDIPDHVEQSSDDIWQSVCIATREALSRSGVNPAAVKGIGFDATCSLVALDADDQPVSVSVNGEAHRNVIVWMDHRALAEAEHINSLNHDVLKYVGGKISPEMQTPKLLWLKKKHRECWQKAARFFDLPDFLVYKATGADVRSLCSTVCKWTYRGHVQNVVPGSAGAWDDSYFRLVGLDDLVDAGYKKIGRIIRPIGGRVGKGLTAPAAAELGLPLATAVAVSIIDAHAGGIGTLGATVDGEGLTEANAVKRLALIGGTSSCHMAVTGAACFVPGVWGPYYSAMVPDMWLLEGGQSATGALIDHVIFSHARAAELKAQANASGKTVYELLNERLAALAGGVEFPAELTKELHLLPYFHGNRSPRSNPLLRGGISGLKLDDSLDALALLYLAAIQAVAYGTRHIIEEMNSNGFAIDTIFACGGGTKNPLFLREHADITGCRIVLPGEHEAVLVGAAILGAVAAGAAGSVTEGMRRMSNAGEIVAPADGRVTGYHNAKYAVFKKMHDDQLNYGMVMKY